MSLLLTCFEIDKPAEMFGFLFRGFVFVSVVTTYTISMWSLISSHFIKEFNSYISSQKTLLSSTCSSLPKQKELEPPCTKANYFADILSDYLYLYQCKAARNITSV